MVKKSFIKKILPIIVTFIIVIVIVIAMIVSLLGQSSLGTYGTGEIPEAVLVYKPHIEEELKKYGREEHINVLLAITTQESGGTASLDIMQSSESLGLPPNTISDPLYSIKVGVSYFDEVMTEAENAGVDVDTAIQAYNMGNGYIDFVAANGGEHSEELAQQFSNQMKAQLGWSVYGDPNYVSNVKRYMGEAMNNVGVVTAEGILQDPYVNHNQGENYIVTSEFGGRIHPKTGEYKPHNGIDLAPIGSANLPIASAGNGTVIFSGYTHGGGYTITIRHDGYLAENGETLHTRYVHLSQPPFFKVGETVFKGDVIGLTGTTGTSTTGVHLHYEVEEGLGNPVNPRKYHSW